MRNSYSRPIIYNPTGAKHFKKIFPIPVEIEKFFRIVENIDSGSTKI